MESLVYSAHVQVVEGSYVLYRVRMVKLIKQWLELRSVEKSCVFFFGYDICVLDWLAWLALSQQPQRGGMTDFLPAAFSDSIRWNRTLTQSFRPCYKIQPTTFEQQKTPASMRAIT